MKTIYKYKIKPTNETPIHEGGKILSVGLDPEGIVCVWALVDPEKPLAPRRIVVLGTGFPVSEEIERGLTFIGTVRDGVIMMHVWAEQPIEFR